MAELEYRDYQDRIITKTMNAYDDNVQSVGISSPTGSGKTIMALSIAKKFTEGNNKTVNWVAMRRNLLTQTAKANRTWFNVDNINFVSMFEATPPRCDLLILDECQHASTVSFNHIDSHSGGAALLGLSATPFRTDHLKLPFQKMISDAGIHRLIQEGWLPPFHHYTMEQYTPHTVAQTYLKDADRWGKSIMFFHKREQCEELIDLVSKEGIRAKFIHGAMNMSEREDILEGFSAGKYQILANIAILTEGFDEPTLQSVFVRDSVKLPTIQMAGRGFRGDKTHCNIVQSRGAHWMFTRHATPKSSFMQKYGNWYSLGSNEQINKTARATATKIATIDIEMPSFLLGRKKKKKVSK